MTPSVQPPLGADAARSAVERRLVSVLFADLVGFTALSADRDPEDVRELLSTYFAHARECIERHGGTVEKFIGDAVMAVWGAPLAGEDDAEEAVLAALEVVAAVRALGDGMDARAAVTTGEVAVTVGAVGEAMVSGQVVNVAARLQAAAPPGTVLVGSTTMLAASSRVAFAPVGELELKGLAAPIPAWRAIGTIAPHRERDRPGALVPELVGRVEELDRIAALVAGVAAERRAQLVLLVGEAGVGKTRLVRELRRRLDASVQPPPGWFEGHVPADRGGVPFEALAEIARAALGLGDAADDATARRTLVTTLEMLIPDISDRRWVEAALLALLGLAPSPRGGRDSLFAGWRTYLERLAAVHGPIVLAFEDLHDAQSDLLDFLDHVVTWAREYPIVLLGLGRPDLLRRRPAWCEERRPTTVVRLNPLGRAEISRLLAGAAPGLPESLARTIVQRADGIPLYAVETVRMLIGEGLLIRDDDRWRPSSKLVGVAVPDTLRMLIAARLDAAGPADRALLEDAAVLGVRFRTTALAAVSAIDAGNVERRLGDLVERDFLVPGGDSQARDGDTHAFVHPLVREVAYATLSRADRRTRHLRAAGYFTSLEDPDAVAAVAAHYLGAYRASRTGPDTEELVELTRVALRAAAEQALTVGAPEQAVAHVEDALALPMAPIEQAALLEIAAHAANVTVRRSAAERYARRALACREAAGDPAPAARAAAHLSGILIGSGQVVDAVKVLEEALGRLPTGTAPEAEAAVLTHLSRAYMRDRQLGRSIVAADRAVLLSERLGLDGLRAEALINKAAAIDMLGHDAEAMEMERAAIRLAEAGGLVWTEVRARSNLGELISRHDARAAVATWRQALDLAARFGNRVFTVLLTTWISDGLRTSATDWDAAIRSLEVLLASDLEEADQHDVEMPLLLILAARGELDAGRFAAWEDLTRGLHDPQVTMGLEASRAEFAWCRGDFGVAVEAGIRAAEIIGDGGPLPTAFRGALWLRDLPLARSLAEQLEAYPDSTPAWKAVLATARGAVAGLEGRITDATALYQDGFRRWHEIGYDWAAAVTALDFVWAVGPGVPEARHAAEEARAVFERVRARVYLERLDAALGGAAGAGAASGHVAGPRQEIATAPRLPGEI